MTYELKSIARVESVHSRVKIRAVYELWLVVGCTRLSGGYDGLGSQRLVNDIQSEGRKVLDVLR